MQVKFFNYGHTKFHILTPKNYPLTLTETLKPETLPKRNPRNAQLTNDLLSFVTQLMIENPEGHH